MAEALHEKPLRVAVVSSGLGHVARGIETWAADTARALRRRGVAATLFRGSGRPAADYERTCPCLRRGGTLNRWLNRAMPPFAWHAGLGNPYDIEQTTFALNLIARLGRRFDIVHTQDPLVALILQRARRAGLLSARTVLAHGTEEPFTFLRKIEFLQHLAPHHLEEARAAGCWREGWTAIGNFIDTERFRPAQDATLRARHGIAPEDLVVLSVAAVKRHHKRIDYLIEEVAQFQRAAGRPVALVLSGSRTEESEALAAMGRELLGTRFHLLLDQPRERMPEIYRLGDVFALCSLKEMMPIALLEAAASGLPCLVSRHPVVRWMAGPGGSSVEMDRPGALAEALASYLDNAHRRAAGEAARRHIETHFSEEAVINEYVTMYRNVRSLAGTRTRS